LIRALDPLANQVAIVRASVRSKLLAGFLAGAVLLVGMAILSHAVIERMGQRVAAIEQIQRQVEYTRRMEWLVTAQSHSRAMAILTGAEASNDAVTTAKAEFVSILDALDGTAPPEHGELLAQMRETDRRYAALGEQVRAVQTAGDRDGALQLHLAAEHPASHELEGAAR
jgi:CHASE3 domain sensor protein